MQASDMRRLQSLDYARLIALLKRGAIPLSPGKNCSSVKSSGLATNVFAHSMARKSAEFETIMHDRDGHVAQWAQSPDPSQDIVRILQSGRLLTLLTLPTVSKESAISVPMALS